MSRRASNSHDVARKSCQEYRRREKKPDLVEHSARKDWVQTHRHHPPRCWRPSLARDTHMSSGLWIHPHCRLLQWLDSLEPRHSKPGPCAPRGARPSGDVTKCHKCHSRSGEAHPSWRRQEHLSAAGEAGARVAGHAMARKGSKTGTNDPTTRERDTSPKLRLGVLTASSNCS